MNISNSMLVYRWTTGLDGFRAEETTYKELVELHEYVTTKLGQKSIILDADDMQREPG